MEINNVRLAPELTIKTLPETAEKTVPLSEIFLHQKPTHQFVAGVILEAAVKWQNYYLVFTTDDIPFEETLRISLFNEHLHLLDSAYLFWIYSTGMFSNLELHEPNIVSFHFFGDTTWSVELLPHSQLRIPFFSEPRGVFRRFNFHRHFVIHGNPVPEKKR